MNEEKFREALSMAISFPQQQLAAVKQSLFGLIQEMEAEKKNLSNEVRRSVYYLTISNDVKRKRIKYIDEILIPRTNNQIESVVNEVFPEAKMSSLNRLKRFRVERSRLMKITGDHTLRVKQNARLLLAVYEEIKLLQDKFQSINEAEVVRNFLQSNNINPETIIRDEIFRLYTQFNGGAIS